MRRSSMEKVGKAILRYSTQPGLGAVRFFEYTLFCFLTGNADMHLKKFSLLTTATGDIILSPAYDLLNTKIAMPDDLDEIALTLNAKQRKLKMSDFNVLAQKLKIPEKTVQNITHRFINRLPKAEEWINSSFLPDSFRHIYKKGIEANAQQIGLVSTS